MKNQQSQAKKLYSKLGPEEQASLMIQAAASENWTEVDAIFSQVPHHDYNCMDQNYLRRVDSLRFIALRYAMEFWEARAVMFYFVAQGDATYTDKSLVKLASIEKAFSDVCARLRVDADLLKKLVNCDKDFGIFADKLPPPDQRLCDLFDAELMDHVLK